jgi:exodeoxyribonuclease V beta subunit
VPRSGPSGDLRARSPNAPIDDTWRIASYSALVAGHELAGAADAEHLAETGLGADPAGSPVEWTPHGFPAGAQAGLFLHELLERLSFPAATAEVLGPLVETLLRQYGFDPRWRPAVERLIGRVLDTPLDELGSLRLRGIEDRRRRNEMAFHFPLESVSDAALDRVLNVGGDRLRFGSVRGLMKGYIDLVFEHQGRYFLADYKSNRLGVRTEDYDHAAMAGAMREHRYDLQYLIYAVALHRYLAQRIADYDYERHFGGAYYLFLRGLDPEQGSRYGVFFERPDAGLIQALDALFSGASGP